MRSSYGWDISNLTILGGPGYAIFASFSVVVMVVGGSGVTFATSTVQSLVHDGLKGKSHVKAIELVWMIQDRGQ